ncbi:hypothetical protein CLAFUR0_20063, partial [Fulvia fulva]
MKLILFMLVALAACQSDESRACHKDSTPYCCKNSTSINDTESRCETCKAALQCMIYASTLTGWSDEYTIYDILRIPMSATRHNAATRPKAGP